MVQATSRPQSDIGTYECFSGASWNTTSAECKCLRFKVRLQVHLDHLDPAMQFLFGVIGFWCQDSL